MERGLLVELSPNEERALQRIAFGFDQTGLRLDIVGKWISAFEIPCGIREGTLKTLNP